MAEINITNTDDIEFNDENRLNIDLSSRERFVRENHGLNYFVRRLNLAKTHEEAERILLYTALFFFALTFGLIAYNFMKPEPKAIYSVTPEILNDIQKQQKQ